REEGWGQRRNHETRSQQAGKYVGEVIARLAYGTVVHELYLEGNRIGCYNWRHHWDHEELQLEAHQRD
ncbi:hypothetical protein LEMLEM_LOCUS27602, partial [Lemmus lemmus]